MNQMIFVESAPLEEGGEALDWYKFPGSGASNDCAKIARDERHVYIGSTDRPGVVTLTHREFDIMKRDIQNGVSGEL